MVVLKIKIINWTIGSRILFLMVIEQGFNYGEFKMKPNYFEVTSFNLMFLSFGISQVLAIPRLHASSPSSNQRIIKVETMIDHTSISVKDYEQSLAFYDKTLAALGYERVMTINKPNVQTAGYGANKKPSFWISPMGRKDEEIGKARGMHIAFKANSVEDIQKWYDLCLQYGGADNGKPGPRPEYHPGYYGAFIIDPNGWRIEACLHHYQAPTK
jgi:catechol 2,3-dioxygenase-like lactoylglutathione lyase family enzyme